MSTGVSGDPSSILVEVWATVQVMLLTEVAESLCMFTYTLSLLCAQWETRASWMQMMALGSGSARIKMP